MINEINLSIEELEKILKFAKKLSPKNKNELFSGRVTVKCDDSSGIGSALKVSVLYEVEGYKGIFTTDITDYETW
jgi:hypothetical protein